MEFRAFAPQCVDCGWRLGTEGGSGVVGELGTLCRPCAGLSESYDLCKTIFPPGWFRDLPYQAVDEALQCT